VTEGARSGVGAEMYLANGCAVIPREATVDLVGRRRNVPKAAAVSLLGFGAQPSYREDLAVLQHTLLKLAEQDAEAYKDVS